LRRRLALLAAPLLLIPAACGGTGSDSSSADDTQTSAEETTESTEPAAGEGESTPEADGPESAPTGDLDGVDVTGELGSQPKVTVDAPFTTDKTTVQIVEEGDGEAIGAGDQVTAQYVVIDGKTGKTLESSWQTGQPVPLDMDAQRLLPGLYSGIIDQPVGSRLAIGLTSEDAFGEEGNPQLGVKPDSALVFVADLIERQAAPEPPPEPASDPLQMAEGANKDAPADLPTVEVDDKGVPQEFSASGSVPKDVQELVAAPIIVGDGPKVEAGQTLTVHYLGQLYPDGEIFDQSWERGETFDFQLGAGGVIPGWDQGLEGQTVGSRVVLAIPSDLAYGPQGSPPTIPADTDLLFVVDILGANGP